MIIRTSLGRGIAGALVFCLLLQGWPVAAPPVRIFLPAPAVEAAAFTLLGPRDYVRGNGSPVEETAAFPGDPAGSFVLRIENRGSAGQYDPVTSAVVTLNGVIVVAPHEFNPGVSVIEKSVPLAAANTLVVELRGQPGSGFTLQIDGDDAANRPPTARAGSDQTVGVGDLVQLDGSGSSDPDGDALSYQWTLAQRPASSNATLSNPSAVQPTFVADAPGNYVLSLVVNDGAVNSAPDEVIISTTNSAPVAAAGPDQSVAVGDLVTLDGSGSSDTDGDALTYNWALVSVPAGSAAALSNLSAVHPTFVADRSGTYTARLVVNDGQTDSAPDTVSITTLNSPPVANAGPDQTAAVGATVTLDGSGSSDVDGNALTFKWSLISAPAGSTASLSNPSQVGPTFTIDEPGTYVAQLIVNDGTVDSAPDTVSITTVNSPPVANAGPDQSVFVGTQVTLDGSGSQDVDGDTLTFSWSLVSVPAGSTAALSDPSAVGPQFTVDVPGDYIAQLIVNDGTTDSAADTVVISTQNSAPVANAGPDQTALVGDMVTLNGSGSSDADGDALTFEWSFVSRPAGSVASFSDPGAVQPTFDVDRFGSYVIQLIVNDGQADSAADTVTITTLNSAPVANAGPDQSVFVGSEVTLDGSASSDVDGNALTFQWSLTSVPPGSTASLSDPTAVTPTFAVDVPGRYVAQLIVNDGTVNSAPDSVSVTTTNSPPVANAGLDQSVFVGAEVTLDGSGSDDADGDMLTYFWAFTSRPMDSSATLSDATAVMPTFTVDRPGSYVVQLIVNDGTVDGAPDTVVIATTNSAPVANAGPDQGALVGATVTLDGTGSHDADFDNLTYQWSLTVRPAGSAAAISDPSAAMPTFTVDLAGTYVAQLIVNDGKVDSAPDTMMVTTTNRTPVASAGADLAALVGEMVTLDGSGSDPDGDMVTFQWSFDVRPMGSTAAIVDPTAEDAVFTPDRGGDYVLRLVVNDGRLDSAPDTAMVTVSVAVPPVIGLTRPDAEAAIVAADLAVGSVTFENSDTVPAGRVISQLPAAGIAVAVGTAVDLVVSNGTGEPVLESIAVTPANVTKAVGQAQQYTATGTWTDGHTENITASVLWQSSDPARAFINAAGLADALDPGPVTILATQDGVSGNASLTAIAAELASIVVTPANPIALVGQSVAFTATGVLTNGTSQNLAGQVTWSSDSGAATINPSTGVASAAAEGGANIRATKDGISGSTLLTVQPTVSDSTLPNVNITAPANNSNIINTVNIVGTATDANFSRYDLAYAPAGSTAFTPITTGTSAVDNGTLGVLDPSLLVNDIYAVRLRVFDRGGNVVETTRTYQVSRDVKVGNFTLSFQDLNVPMVGLPIAVNRLYDSRDKRVGDFGMGWRLDIQTLRLTANRVLGTAWTGTRTGGFPFSTYCITHGTEAHKISITLADGTVEEFDMTTTPSCQPVPFNFATASFVPRPGTRGTLQVVGNTDILVQGSYPGPLEILDLDTFEHYNRQTFQYTTYEGMVFVINKTTGVQSARDPNGNTLTFNANGIVHSAGASVTFVRDAQGRITRMTDPSGRQINYTYDANGDLSTVADAGGNTTRFFYNLSHGVIEVRDPRGLRPLRNEYGDDGRLVAHIDATGRRIEYDRDLAARQEIVQDRNGGQTVYEYDAAGKIISVTDPLGLTRLSEYDARGNKTKETDPSGDVTTFTYDANNNLLSTTRTIDGQPVKTSQTYNARGQALTETDPLGRVRSNAYDGAGRLLSASDPLGNASSYTYDARGNQLSATDALASTTSFAYDSAGRQIQKRDPLGHVTDFTYDASGNLTSETDPRGGVTSYTYDAAGRRTAVTNPLGHVTRTEYDPAGHTTADVDALGNRTTHTYDAAGRLLETTFADGTSVQHAYDAEGNRIATIDQLGRRTEFTYDARNNLTRVTHPDGAIESFTYDEAGRELTNTDPLGQTSEQRYDALGREIERRDPLGHVATSTYDRANNLLSTTDPNGQTMQLQYDANNRVIGTTLPGGQTTSTTYDAVGRAASETDAGGNTTSFAYDAADRLTSVTEASGAVIRFEYDEAGHRTAIVDARGNRTTFTYDLAKRVTSKTLPSGGVETLTYDAADRMVSKQDALGRTINFEYDAMGRLVTRMYPDGTSGRFTYTATGRRATATDARGVTSYSYDNRDRLIGVTHPDGQTIQYTYDAAGNLLTISSLAGVISYIYDNGGRLQRVLDPAGREATYTYDAAGNRTSLVYPNGTSAAYTYDQNNRLTRLTHDGPAGVLAEYQLTLGPAGNRTRIDESTGAIRHYTYDSLYRLTGERVTDAAGNPLYEHTYTYDGAGNRLTKASSVGADPATTNTYAYNDADQLLSEDGVTYTHDLNGNLTSKTDAAGVTTYEYDFDNRLFRVMDPSGATTLYLYDADGNRVEKRDVTGTVRYLVDVNRELSQVLAEYTVGGMLAASYVYADDLISMARGGQTSFYHFDGTGSTRLLTDLAGIVTDSYSFDAFGNLLARTGVTDNPFLYTGQQYDPNTGFYYLRARFYQPSTGRFLTVDPQDPLAFEPRSLHRYVYSWNDPLNRTDPSGRFTLGSVSISISIHGILSGIASLSVGVLIDYVLVKVTGAEFNIWVSIGSNLALGAVGGVIGAGLKAAATLIRRSPNTMRLLQAAARRGIAEHTRWTQMARDALKAAGRAEWVPPFRGGCGVCYTLNRAIRDKAGKVFRIGGKQGRPDYVDYANNMIMDLKPVPKAIYDAGEAAVEAYLNSTHKAQKELYIKLYSQAQGVAEDAISFVWDVYVK